MLPETLTATEVSNIAQSLSMLADDIEKFALEIEKAPVAELAAHYWRLKQAHDALEAARKAINKPIDRINKYVLPSRLEAEDLDKIQIPELARSFYIQTKYSARTIDKEAGYAWLRESGNEGLITETVNASTLSAFLRDMVSNQGIDPPEGTFELTSYYTTGSSKYTPKE